MVDQIPRRTEDIAEGRITAVMRSRTEVSAPKPRAREKVCLDAVIKAKSPKERTFEKFPRFSLLSASPGTDKIESSLKRRHVSPIDIDTSVRDSFSLLLRLSLPQI